MHLDLVDDVHALFAVHHIDRKPSPAEAPRAANPVEVRLVVGLPVQAHGEVKVDHERHLLHINTWAQHKVKMGWRPEDR